MACFDFFHHMIQKFDKETLVVEIAKLLKEGETVTITVKGNSMRPALRDGRDSVTLRACAPHTLKPGAVVLAAIKGTGTTVLHRIVARKGNRLTLQGDGNRDTEEADVADVAGVAVAVSRNRKTCRTDHWAWQLFSRGWMAVLAARRFRNKCRSGLAYLKQVSDGHRRGIALNCMTGILSVGFSLLFIYLCKQTIDSATAGKSEDLAGYAALLVATTLLQLACNALDNWVAVRTQIGAGNGLRHRIFAHLLRSRWNELEPFHTGDVVNRIENDASSLVGLLTATIPALVVMGLQLLAAFGFFCLLDARLPWLVVGILPVFLAGSRLYMKYMYRHTHKLRRSDSRIQAIIQESLQQRNVIKALEMDKGCIGQLDRQQESLRVRLMKRTRFSILARTCVSGAFSGGYLVAFLWGTWGLMTGHITFGTMAAFLQLVGKIQQPIWDMARLIPSLVEGMASMRRLRELEALQTEEQGKSIRFVDTPSVVVDGIGFQYAPGEAPVFGSFSCTFPPGSRTAVMGETGRGKTTLVRLLLAFDRPQSGQIRLQTADKEAEVSARTRCNFTYVPQGNTLFSGTIRQNLLMGNPQATDEEMRRALHTAVADFVFSLPDGMDSFIGEQGSGLSEGQAQRIAIARALLRDCHIFLLDEATSALDEETERKLMENLERDYANRTFIFVTHHAAVAEWCGQVVRI